MKAKKDNVSSKKAIIGYSLVEEITITTANGRDMVNTRPIHGYVYALYVRYRYLLHNDAFGAQRGPFPFTAMDPVGLAQDLQEYVRSDGAPARAIGVIASVDVRDFLNGQSTGKPIFMLTNYGRSLEEAFSPFYTWADEWEPKEIPQQVRKPIQMVYIRPKKARLLNLSS